MALGVDPWALANMQTQGLGRLGMARNRQRNSFMANLIADMALNNAIANSYPQPQTSWSEPRENYSPAANRYGWKSPQAPLPAITATQGGNDPMRYGLTPQNQWDPFWSDWTPGDVRGNIDDWYSQQQQYRDDHNRMVAQSQADWQKRRGQWDATKGNYGKPDPNAEPMFSFGGGNWGA